MPHLSLKYRFLSLIPLVLLTAYWFFSMEAYQVVGEDLVKNPLFTNNMDNWEVNLDSKQLNTIEVIDGKIRIKSINKAITISQQIPKASDVAFLQVKARVSIKNILAGEKSWQKARIYVVNQVGDTSLWKMPHHLFISAGSKSAGWYQRIFAIHPSASHFKLGIELPKGEGGVIQVDSLSVYMVEKDDYFLFLTILLVLFWLITITWLVKPLARGNNLHWVMICSLLILTLVLLPENVKNEIEFYFTYYSPDLQSWLNSSLSLLSDTFDIKVTVSMLGHFMLFFVLTCVIAISGYKFNIKGILYLFVFAAITEIIQFLTTARNPRITDFIVDITAILLAVFVVFIVKKLLKQWRK